MCNLPFPGGLWLTAMLNLWRGCVNICAFTPMRVKLCLIFFSDRRPLWCEWCRSRETEERCDTRKRLKGNIYAQVLRVLLVVGDWRKMSYFECQLYASLRRLPENVTLQCECCLSCTTKRECFHLSASTHSNKKERYLPRGPEKVNLLHHHR